MVKWSRRLLGVFVIVVIFGAIAVGLKSLPAAAEGHNAFPNISNGSDWEFNNKSPDPNLMWLYKDGPPDETLSKTTHVLRNRSIGRNKGTRLRVYYPARPVQVSVTVDVVACDLDAPFANAGPVRVVLGGEEVYSKGTRAPQKADHYEKYRVYPTGGGGRVDGTQGVVEGTDRFSQSPVCDNYGSYNVPIWVYRENCAPAQQQNGGICGNNGTETYTLDTAGNGNHTIGATNTKLDGKTFTVNFPATGNGNSTMGFDSDTGLYFADLDIDLDARNDPNLPPANVMQRITFNVTANNTSRASNGNSMRALMGYRRSPSEVEAAKYFGLEGNGGRTDTFPDYGTKFAIPFGMNCGDTRESFDGRIVLYDPDANPSGFGTSYATVFRRNPSNGNIVRLGRDDYDIGANAGWDAGNERITITAGSNANSAFSVKEIKRGFQYMLTVSNPNHAGGFNSAINVWSLFLPTDSINGLINCRYDLTPKTTNVAPTFSAYGDTLNPKGSIDNSENSTATGDHEWRITRAVFASRPSDLSRTMAMDSTLVPCDFMASRSGAHAGCAGIYVGTYPAEDSKSIDSVTGAHAVVGTYVCYLTSVKNPTWQANDDNKWRHSSMLCSVASVKPKLQVWGGDVKAGGTIDTSTMRIAPANRTYGSWGEYGVLSNERNIGMASGRGLTAGNPLGTQDNWSNLTFANNAGYGNYNGVQPLAYNPGAATENLAVAGGVCPLGARNYAAGTKAVIYCDGTLTITGNQTYATGVASIANIPNVKIVARNVQVNAGVTTIDPWVVARQSNGTYGSVYTCGNVTTNASSATCPKQVKFNGPVLANSLYALRTNDTITGDPAEIFNLRVSNILSAYAGRGTDQPVARTDLITELPPRF